MLQTKTKNIPHTKIFWAIVVVYVTLGLIYSWATPPFESSDEYKHFPVIQHIQQTGELVVLDADHEGKWKQEGAQPPLYYLLMAAATSWIDTSDLNEVHIENRHAFIGNAAQVKNKNLLFHDPAAEQLPWSGSILAVHVIRLLSIGLGIGTLWFGWQTGRLLLNENGALTVVALTAFNPMFLFVSAAVNNDSLSILLGSAGLLMLVKIWHGVGVEGGGTIVAPKNKFASRPLQDYALLGLICGLALLTKLSLATLLLLAGLVTARAIFFAWQQDNRLKNLIKPASYGLLTLTIAFAFVGPWLLRNLRLYGDLTGLNAFIAVQGTRDNPTMGGVDWIAEFGTFFRSFWGLFGGVNVFAPQWFYTVCNLLFLIGIFGLLLKVWQERKNKGLQRSFNVTGLILPLLMVLITMTLLIRWTIISPAFQGRLLFPALIGVNVLWAAGLQVVSDQWSVVSNRWSVAPSTFNLQLATSTFFFTMAAFIPFTHIAPAYAFPEPVSVPAGSEFGPITYTDLNGESIALVGVALEPGQTAVPGDQVGVAVTLYWTTETGVSTDYVSSVHALGREYISVGQVDRYPGWGMWPPTRWRPGDVYADPYHVWLKPGNKGPALIRLDVSVLDTSGAKNRILTPIGTDGSVLDLVLVGEAKLGQTALRQPAHTSGFSPVDFTDFVTLAWVEAPSVSTAGSDIRIDLEWHANGTPAKDYTVFVQLVDPDGKLIESGDQPPLNGDYPTRLWEAGEQIDDFKQLQIPADADPGVYQILIGMYDPLTGERMQRLDGGDSVMREIEVR
ncbi:MAG: hypothetical protein ACI9EW_001336 [Cellvibrionaceae bacterium]|jgi:hypothetical protein